jgi:mannosyltransferase
VPQLSFSNLLPHPARFQPAATLCSMRHAEQFQDLSEGRLETDRALQRWRTIALLFTILLSLVVRVIGLGSKSVFADELASFGFAQLNWMDFWRLIRGREANMAFYYVLLRLWSRLDTSVSFLRFLSVIPAVATVPALYCLGKKLFSIPTALLASVLLSLNAFHISYSQAGRGYSLVVFLVTLSCLFFVSSLETPTPASMTGYVIVSTAAMYGHFFAGFVLLAQFVTLLLLSPPRATVIRQALLLVVVGVASIPLFIFAAAHQTEPISWVQPITGKEFYHFLTYLSGSGLKFGVSVIGLAIAVRQWWRRTQLDSEATLPFLFLSIWLLLPIGITLLLSLWKPVFSPRFLMICLPAFVLLVAEGITAIATQWARCLLAGMLVISCLTALPAYYRQPGIEDWKSAVSYMHQYVQAADTLIVNNPAYRPILGYSFPEFGFALPTQHVVSGPAKRIHVPASDHIWLLLCHAAPSEAEDVASLKQQFAWLGVQHFNGIEVIEFAARRPGEKP